MIPVAVLLLTLLISKEALPANCLCQVYPTEYAYHGDSVYRTERDSANCRNYSSGLSPHIKSEDYIHCDGTQLKLTDSNHDIGSEQYTASDFYVWPNETRSQMLFIFSRRINLVSITLHYYSDSSRGLPRRRFWAVPDDFDVWDAPVSSYNYVEFAAVLPGEHPAGHRLIAIGYRNNLNATKILFSVFRSSFWFALSEVKFYSRCNYLLQPKPKKASELLLSTSEMLLKTKPRMTAKTTFSESTNTPSFTTATYNITGDQSVLANQREATTAWILFAIMVVLFSGSLTVNVIVLAFLVYKKRQVGGENGQHSEEYEIEGNPCYEARTEMKQSTEREAHVYEAMREKRAK